MSKKSIIIFSIIAFNIALLLFLIFSGEMSIIIGKLGNIFRSSVHPSEQYNTCWETDDGLVSFDVGDGPGPIYGRIKNGDEIVEVYFSMVSYGSEIYVYSYEEYQKTEKPDENKILEFWKDIKISKDEFIVQVIDSTYLKSGDKLVFHKTKQGENNATDNTDAYINDIVAVKNKEKLYCLFRKNGNYLYEGNLICVENDETVSDLSLVEAIYPVLFISDNCFYYTDSDAHKIYKYDAGAEREVLIFEDSGCKILFYKYAIEDLRDGSCFISADQTNKESDNTDFIYLKINNDTVEKCDSLRIDYLNGGNSYCFKSGSGNWESIFLSGTDSDAAISTGQAKEKRYYITDYGILVHNCSTDGDNILTLVDKRGEVVTLFSTYKIETRSTISVINDTVWLSFTRVHNYGTNNYDEIKGTYKINLKDMSCSRISEMNFERIFAFRDGFLYGVDKDLGLFKMDFDGKNIKEIVVEESRRNVYTINAVSDFKNDNDFKIVINDATERQQEVNFDLNRNCVKTTGIKAIKWNNDISPGDSFDLVKKKYGKDYFDIGSGFFIPTYITDEAYFVSFQLENNVVVNTIIRDAFNGKIIND